MPDVGAVVGLELLDARDLALLKALWGRLEWPEEQATYKGHEIFVKTGPEGVAVRLAFIGNLAIATVSEKSMAAVIDRADDKSADSLAKSAEYTQLVGAVGGLKPGASTWIVRVAPMANMVSGILGMAMLGGGDDPEKAQDIAKISAVVQGLGLDGVRWVGGSDWRETTGRVRGTAMVSITPGAQGLLPRCMADTGSIDRKIIERVPGDSLSMSAGSIDWLPAVYDFAMSTFKALEPTEYETAQAKLKEFMGESDLRQDILVNLHGTLLSYGVPAAFPEQPSQIMRIGVKDPNAFVKALRTLTASVATALDFPADAVSLKESDHEGRTLYELDLSQTPLAVGMIQPAFAVEGGELVICLQSTKALKTALNGTPAESSLAQNKDLSGFLDSLAEKGKLTSMSFTDNAKTFGAIYGGIAGAAQMFGGGASDLPVDLSLMPSEQAITKHLAQSWSGGYVSADGATFVTQSDGQFQLGDFVPLLMTTGIIGVSMATGAGAVAAEPVDEDPYEVVRRHLGELGAGMTVFKLSEGRYPDSIDDLVRPTASYPDGCLGKSEAPVDPWGHAYNFRLNERGKPFLWSSGPDGVDQGGEGDDIVKG
jgi:general secretion pathway protein G